MKAVMTSHSLIHYYCVCQWEERENIADQWLEKSWKRPLEKTAHRARRRTHELAMIDGGSYTEWVSVVQEIRIVLLMFPEAS